MTMATRAVYLVMVNTKQITRFYGLLTDVEQIMERWCKYHQVEAITAEVICEETKSRIAWYTWKRGQ